MYAPEEPFREREGFTIHGDAYRAYAQPTVCRITIGSVRNARGPSAPLGCDVLGPSANPGRSGDM